MQAGIRSPNLRERTDKHVTHFEPLALSVNR